MRRVGRPGTRPTGRRWWLLSSATLLVACGGGTDGGGDPSAELAAVVDELWEHGIENDPMARVGRGMPVTQLPDLSFEGAQAEVAFQEDVMRRLLQVDRDGLSLGERLTLDALLWGKLHGCGGPGALLAEQLSHALRFAPYACWCSCSRPCPWAALRTRRPIWLWRRSSPTS